MTLLQRGPVELESCDAESSPSGRTLWVVHVGSHVGDEWRLEFDWLEGTLRADAW